MSKNDLLGQVFGKLTVIGEESGRQHGQVRWKCRCDCGNIRIVLAGNLRSKTTNSCGCGKGESNIRTKTTHGMAGTRFYRIWTGAKDRTTNPKSKYWDRYGGRGITFDSSWLHFENFYKDMYSSYEDSLTLDRIENDKGYNKGNCRWATMEVQINNTRVNRMVTMDGITDTLKNTCRRYEIVCYSTVKSRLSMGWNVEDSIKNPLRKIRRHS